MNRKEFIKQLDKLAGYSVMLRDSLENYHTDSFELNNYDKSNIQAFVRPCEDFLNELINILHDKTIDRFKKP